MARLFGTDGIRGLANGEVLTAELAMRLAGASGARLRQASDQGYDGSQRPLVAVARDTRPSGEMLEAAAVAGFTSAGCDVALLGVVPTPAVAHATARGAAQLGLMITASHNPEPDNGLKLFAAGGHKLPDADEDALEAAMAQPWARSADVGRVRPAPELVQPWLDGLVASVGRSRVSPSWSTARRARQRLLPRLYRRAGADVVAPERRQRRHQRRLRGNPSGGCSRRPSSRTAPTSASRTTAMPTAAWSSRATARSSTATRCSGCWPSRRKDAGLPHSDVLVATVMSNLGLHQAMAHAGIASSPPRLATATSSRRCAPTATGSVGSRAGTSCSPTTRRRATDCSPPLLSWTGWCGPGARSRSSPTPSRCCPQVLVNVRADRERAAAPDVLRAVADEEAVLAGTGRVLLRPSGTEALVRVMVEAPSEEQARAVADRLAAVVAS